DREGPCVAMAIENRATIGELGDESAIAALVVIPARLLPARQIGEIARAVFQNRNARWHLAAGASHILLQPFEQSYWRIVAQDDVLRRHDLVERLQHRLR